jgi:glucosamine--fructose-6-phosphate aminotransferase (isomerizing)
MCGIVGYLGDNNAINIVLEGLSLLQNRGYDSVGISTIKDTQLQTTKYASTSINNALGLLESAVMENPHMKNTNIAIGHTRWATHGGKTDINAHPHHDNDNRIALVHNGIIENFHELKSELIEKKYVFRSSTDTEVIAVLIGYFLDQGEPIKEAIQKAVNRLRGTWALCIIHKDYPNTIWAIRNGSPLLLGIDEKFVMVASEQIAFRHYIKQYIVLDNHDLFEVMIENNKISYNKNIQHYTRNDKTQQSCDLTPAPFDHWMLKEIMEQSDAVIRAMNNGGRINDNTTVKLGGLDTYKEALMNIDHLILLGCGTSYHSGLWSLSIFKSLTIFDTVSLYDGAEFHSQDIPKRGKTACVLISQSGETKDLHRCIQIIQENNMISIGIVNVIDSFIARETNCGIYLNAGREVAVASTKSFTNQCVVLSLLAIWFSQNKGTSIEKRRKIICDLRMLPIQIKNIYEVENMDKIKELSHTFQTTHSMFVLGKGKEEAVAKEGALKIKEVTYIHAEGYSSSALKHGPFGLLEPGLPVILLDVNDKYREKNENVYQEVVARDAYVIRISDQENGTLCIDKNTTYGGILANIDLQLLSYFCAIDKGYNPDYPRNLAKVVTVE